MAYSESDVPEDIRDILAYMSREMRQRVLADYETHYAPFLSMLAGWKGALQTHYAYGEDAAIARLQEQFFPLGEWKFPAQGLAIPQRPPERTTDIRAESEMTDSSLRPWLSCGEGWVHPTALHQASLQTVDSDWIVLIDVDYLGAGQVEPLLERGQLAFVAGAEEFVSTLAEAEWWVQTERQRPRKARFSRYGGYMSFEREIQSARLNQKHLELWLPPCYPYSRKIVRLAVQPNAQPDPDAPDTSWAGNVTTGFRFIGVIRNPNHRAVAALRSQANARRAGQLVYLNPIPVVQTAVQSNFWPAPFPRHGMDYSLRATGAKDVYAGVVYTDDVTAPTSLYRVASNDPKALYDDVVMQFPQNDARRANAKFYYGSFGQESGDSRDEPGVLDMTPLKFTVPFRIIGGATVGSPENRAEWARSAWYHSVLRPPMLTEGDITELIRQRKNSFGDLLRFKYATREILHDPAEGSTHWRSYLWPSIIPREDSFNSEASRGGIPTDGRFIPLIQSLRMAFERGPAAATLPDFLVSDVANYLASVLSQYFVMSCFRVEGRVV